MFSAGKHRGSEDGVTPKGSASDDILEFESYMISSERTTRLGMLPVIPVTVTMDNKKEGYDVELG